MSVTIKDIAKQCGVGVSTVSRALNNHPDINPQTREMIMKVIRETGFVPNDSARYLKRGESNSLALLVKGISNPFFSEMIRIMEMETEKRGYSVILRHVSANEDEVAVAYSLVRERRLKGIIFLGGNFTHDGEALKKLGVPYIFSTIGNVNENTNDDDLIANIAIDDVEASREAVDYLIQQGHRNIAIVTDALHVPSVGQLRFRGYRKALEAHGIPYREELVYEVNDGTEHYTRPNGYKAARSLLSAHPEITAFFCISDVLAFGVCRAVVERGKRIPLDVSVVGFDGIEEGDYYIPKLTTVRQPVEQMAEETVNLLFDMIQKKAKPKNIIMPAQLIIKESSGTGYRG